MEQKPRYEIETYRQFIRDAEAYVSLIIGRRVKASEANLLTDDEIAKIALQIDARVSTLKPMAEKK